MVIVKVAGKETKGKMRKMEIKYSGGWGYWRYAEEIEAIIEAKYPGKFMIDAVPDRTVTRRVEAYIGKTLVYSRAKHGILEDETKQEKLFERIEEALKKK